MTATEVRNQFNVRLTTKRNEESIFHIRVKDAPVGMRWVPTSEDAIPVPGQSEIDKPFVVTMDREHYKGPTPLIIEVTGEPGGGRVENAVEFLGPDPRLMPAVEKEGGNP